MSSSWSDVDFISITVGFFFFFKLHLVYVYIRQKDLIWKFLNFVLLFDDTQCVMAFSLILKIHNLEFGNNL